jgi:hypothetical protein
LHEVQTALPLPILEAVTTEILAFNVQVGSAAIFA